MKLPLRFSISGLMAFVAVASCGFAALRSGSPMWAGGLYLVTYGLLALALVGAICRGASERAWWLGFALFGFGYLRLAFAFEQTPVLPTSAFLARFGASRPDRYASINCMLDVDFAGPLKYHWVVGQCLWCLLAATIGGLLAHAIFARPANLPADLDFGPRSEERPTRTTGWRRITAGGLAGLVTLTTLLLIGTRSDPAIWAGAMYLLTWALLGIAALGFACGRGKRRMIWFGAALFGLGYMVLNRGPDSEDEIRYGRLVADQFLTALRPGLPQVVSGFPAATPAMAAENSRIRKALDQPVPMSFPKATALEDVLNHIRSATRTASGRELAFYVDPIGMQEAEKTMQSTIQIDLEGFPLSTTLRYSLQQLGLCYLVRDGLVYITDVHSEDLPAVVDYYLLLGHSLLALVAAALGACVVPLISNRMAGQPA